MSDKLNGPKACGNWMIHEDVKYDRNNFWVKTEGRIAYIGLSDYGQWVIGDILYLDLVPQGAELLKGERFGSVESGKWVGNLMAPVSGHVREYNPAVVADPRVIQEDPYGKGWIMKVELESIEESETLLDHAAYAEFVKEQARDAA
ncbi:MAG TPA: glycine cleavage system protein GcvH [Methanoregulaceae archaeon]|nr:glycine cleavage system protein GcvH [Methanoregulaceae archaeon]